MDKKEFERLEDEHLQKLRAYDEAAWDLYDVRQACRKDCDRHINFLMELQQRYQISCSVTTWMISQTLLSSLVGGSIKKKAS
ncbi:hypothetical protein ACVR0S_09750 [Streptococcus dentapri]|uniref:Uncharacterized protein n=1 Tax=Streptococcus dentapri TaxID=573564 RepID=A0ABV8D3K1_9STRE